MGGREPRADGGDPPVAAVACEGADLLALFDLADGERVGEIGVGSHPVHVCAHEGTVSVATMGDRAVTVVGADGTVDRVETGVLGPSHFALADDRLFVPCTAGDAVAVIDPVAAAMETRIGVGAEPHEIAVADGHAYVGSRADGEVTVLDVAARERVGRVDVAAETGSDARVQGVHVEPASGDADGSDGGPVGYAVDGANAALVRFDPGAGDREPTDSVPVGADPYDLAVREDRLFVPARADGTVHAVTPDLDPITVHDGFSEPVDVVRVDGAEWVIDRGDAAVRSLSGAAVETPAPSIHATVVPGEAVGRETDCLLCSHYDDAAVSLVDPREGVVWERDAPSLPFGSLIA